MLSGQEKQLRFRDFGKPSKPAKPKGFKMSFNGKKGRLEVLARVNQDEPDTEPVQVEAGQSPAVVSPLPPAGKKRGRPPKKKEAEEADRGEQVPAEEVALKTDATPASTPSVPKPFRRR